MEELDYASADRDVHALGDVIATALITASVVPFVQELAKRAADETYDGVRGWLRGLFRNADTKRVPPGHTDAEIVVVRDPDHKLSLVVSTALPDHAISALDQLDVGQITSGSRVYWDERTGLWRVEKN